VEAADEQVEALYGQDIDTATYNSAFPTIKVCVSFTGCVVFASVDLAVCLDWPCWFTQVLQLLLPWHLLAAGTPRCR
jgi:hypothetical protein